MSFAYIVNLPLACGKLAPGLVHLLDSNSIVCGLLGPLQRLMSLPFRTQVKSHALAHLRNIGHYTTSFLIAAQKYYDQPKISTTIASAKQMLLMNVHLVYRLLLIFSVLSSLNLEFGMNFGQCMSNLYNMAIARRRKHAKLS